MLRVCAIPDDGDAVVDPLPLDLRVVAVVLGDKAVALGLASFFTKPEHICVDASRDWSIVVDEGCHLRLIWRTAGVCIEKVGISALHDLALFITARVAGNRGILIGIAAEIVRVISGGPMSGGWV